MFSKFIGEIFLGSYFKLLKFYSEGRLAISPIFALVSCFSVIIVVLLISVMLLVWIGAITVYVFDKDIYALVRASMKTYEYWTWGGYFLIAAMMLRRYFRSQKYAQLVTSNYITLRKANRLLNALALLSFALFLLGTHAYVASLGIGWLDPIPNPYLLK